MEYTKKFSSTHLFSLLILSFLCSCSSSQSTTETKAAKPPPTDPVWQNKMQALSDSLSALLPVISSPTKFASPANAPLIEVQTAKLKSLAQSLQHTHTANADPSMTAMSGLFEEDIERAIGAWNNGNREFSRRILRDTTSYCIECHTESKNGPNFPRLNLQVDTKQLSNIDRAEFFAATRQFDRALDAYTAALNKDLTDQFEWENAARTALAITVRVHLDPRESDRFISRLQKMKSAPKSIRPALAQWKHEVQVWQREKSKTPPLNLAKVEKAEALIASAQTNGKFPLDRSRDIEYFRAESLTHEVLQSGEADPHLRARALYLAGVAGEATRDLNFWTLHDSYYEQCIRTLPHSSEAQRCFHQLSDSITLGYTGSSGTHIPGDVATRLQAFEKLAKQVQPVESEKQ